MARGKITEYQQGGFSKQAVGTPGVDRSGEIIGEGIASLGGAIAQYEEKSNALSAQSKFNDFRFQYENMKARMQEDYKNDPLNYADAVNVEKQKLVDAFSKNMSGGELKKFKQYEMNFAGQEIDSIVGWSVKREQEINVDKAKGGFYDVEYASESATTPEELKKLLGDPNNIVEGEQSIENAKKMASAILDPGVIKELGNRTTKAVIENHLSARIRADATGTYIDLMEGKYDDVISTEQSFSFQDEDGKEVLIPTIVDGKRVSQKEAIAHYRKTGEHLGKFETVEEADAMAEKIHQRVVPDQKGGYIQRPVSGYSGNIDITNRPIIQSPGIVRNKNLLRHYTASAYQAMVSDGYREQFKNYATAAVELAQMGDLIRDRKMSVGDVNRKIQWAELNKNRVDVNGERIVTDNYLRGLYANRDKALGLRQITQAELTADQRTAAEKFESRWFDYLAGRKKKAKAQPSDYDNVIGLYADLEELNIEGVIDDTEFEKKKQLLNNKLMSDINPKGVSASLNEALQKAGNYGWNDMWGNPKDVYSVGYNIIDDHFKKNRGDLSAEEKLRYRQHALIEYTRRINAYPEEKRNPEDKQRFAIAMLYGNEASGVPGLFKELDVYQHPETKTPLKYGQMTMYNNIQVVCLGADPKTGELIFGTPDELKKNAGK